MKTMICQIYLFYNEEVSIKSYEIKENVLHYQILRFLWSWKIKSTDAMKFNTNINCWPNCIARCDCKCRLSKLQSQILSLNMESKCVANSCYPTKDIPIGFQHRHQMLTSDLSLTRVQSYINWYSDIPVELIQYHYSGVIMSTMASQITSLTIVYSTVYSGADHRKHQSSALMAFVRGNHRWLAQEASNAENVSIWWRHHVVATAYLAYPTVNLLFELSAISA